MSGVGLFISYRAEYFPQELVKNKNGVNIGLTFVSGSERQIYINANVFPHLLDVK